MSRFRWFAPSALLLATAIAACDGAESSVLFATPATTPLGSDPGQSDDDAGAPSSSGGPGTTEKDASVIPDGGRTDDASPGEVDAGADAATNDESTLRCGDDSCSPSVQVCCLSSSQGKPKFQCLPDLPISCIGATKIECDDQTDCAGNQVCCGSLVQNEKGKPYYAEVACRTTCEATADRPVARFCNPLAKVDECAAVGRTCKPSETLLGYYVCND